MDATKRGTDFYPNDHCAVSFFGAARLMISFTGCDLVRHRAGFPSYLMNDGNVQPCYTTYYEMTSLSTQLAGKNRSMI